MKILVYRTKANKKIAFIDNCPPYTDQVLKETIEDFNNSDPTFSVESAKIKEDTLEYFLLNNYMSKKSNKQDIDECLTNLYSGTKRLQIVFDNIKEELERLNEQNRINQ